MIGRLQGTLVYKKPPEILLDVNGVGYELEAPMTTFYSLPLEGSPATLYTHLVVREDAQLLYGFASENERLLFRSLIKINGVGPKLAITILSGISTDDFIRCINDNDVATLVRLPGVGKKTAERLVIEMRDRLSLLGHSDAVSLPGAVDTTGLPGKDEAKDAIGALVALGYKQQEADKMVRGVETSGRPSQDIIRDALKSMAR